MSDEPLSCPSAEEPTSVRPDARTVAAGIALVLALRFALPVLPVPRSALADMAGSLLYLAALIGAGAGLGALMGTRRGWAWLGALVIGAAAWSLRVIEPGPLWAPLVRGAGDWAVFVAATLVGSGASGIVREPNLLPPIALTAAVVDFVAIRFGGPTTRMLEARPDIVQAASTALPSVGALQAPMANGIVPSEALAIMGLGDIVFVGFVFGALMRYVPRFGPSAAWTIVGGVAGMAVVLVTGLTLPGLPFLALGCLLANARCFRYSRGELLSLAVVAIFLALFCVGLAMLGPGMPAPLSEAMP